MYRLRFVLVITITVMFSIACSPAPPQHQTVVNQALGLQLAVLPDDLQVIVNEGSELALGPRGDIQSVMTFSIGPEDPSPNLVAMVHADRKRIEALSGGQYLGARELQTPFGTAFYSRGRWMKDDALVEETRVIGFHPRGDRTMIVSYVYPAADDSAHRVTRLLDLVAQIEVFTTPVSTP